MIDSVVKKLKVLKGVKLFLDCDLSNYTTMKLQANGDLLVVSELNALKEILVLFSREGIPYRLIGWGANQLIKPDCPGYFIKLDFPFDKEYLKEKRDEYKLPASVSLSILTGAAIKHGLVGWEVFTGIPASLGGAIFMNAGTSLGEIGPLVSEVNVINSAGEELVYSGSDLNFKYRSAPFIKVGEVIVSAKLRHLGVSSDIAGKIKNYLEYRKNTQPMGLKNCGCVFKNYNNKLSAGKVIDLLGLKGLAVGGLRVSTKHSNFIINEGNGTYQDFLTLKNLVNRVVNDSLGIEFELEVKLE